MEIKDIAWVAGLLEGEGCFGYSNGSPLVQLGMTDFDVVAKLRNIISPKSLITDHRHSDPTCKDVYTVRLFGSSAIQWMMTIYPFMGSRRRGRIKEIVTNWVNNGRKVHGSNYCKNGHHLIGRIRNLDGSCRICKKIYSRKYRWGNYGINRAS